MKAIANYNLTIDGVIYAKGNQYDIDPKINDTMEYGGEYFTEIKEVKEEKLENKKELSK